MLTLPTVDTTTGELSHQILPISSDNELNPSQTGVVIAVDTTSSGVLITLPNTDYVNSESIYFLLAAGTNALEIFGYGSDQVDNADGIQTSTQWSALLLLANQSDANWSILTSAGTWSSVGTTT